MLELLRVHPAECLARLLPIRAIALVAAAALYLAGDQSSFTTGAELFVDGGATQL